ncbi:MAG: GxxExxY protein [Bacteroidaceae bacterium]|nr:GxxExxY protein [Bacteroidaceae bacterium]
MELNVTNLVNHDLITRLKQYVYDIVGCCQHVHAEMGPWLNEYIYQEALQIAFDQANISYEKEYYFSVCYQGMPLTKKHFVDFRCKGNVFVECKAIQALGNEQRQQLWNYMRLTGTPIGILYNFAPVKDQCEKYYYDPTTKTISAF